MLMPTFCALSDKWKVIIDKCSAHKKRMVTSPFFIKQEIVIVKKNRACVAIRIYLDFFGTEHTLGVRVCLTRELGKTCGWEGCFFYENTDGTSRFNREGGVKDGTPLCFLSKKNCVALPNIFFNQKERKWLKDSM